MEIIETTCRNENWKSDAMKHKRMVALVVFIVFSLSVAAPGVPQVRAVGGLALDGTAEGSAGNLTLGSTTCATNTSTLSTSNKPDVMIALLITNDTLTKVNSVTDTGSLTWTFRVSQTEPDNNAQLFEYYAIAPSLLPSEQVTFTLSSNHAAVGCLEFAFSGANTAAPFDSNAAIPVRNSDILSTTASLSYTTNDPNDVLIYYFGMCRQSVSNDSPGGFTAISSFGVSQSSNCPSNGNIGYAYYRIVTAAQSSNTYTNVACTGCGAGVPWAIIGDAIQSTPYVSSISPFHGLSASFIKITGTSFNGTVSVDFCGAKAAFTVVSDTLITATLPICAAGNNLDITVTNAVGTSPTSANDLFYVDPSPPLSASLTASPTSLSSGEKVTFTVSTSGGYGALSYSYTSLPAGCVSTNTTTLSCNPSSSGNYDVKVTVTDRAGGSATATASITVSPQRVLGLPQAVGLAVIFGAIVGTSAVLILAVALTLRRKTGRQAPTTA
jgi:hypothetical protein